MREIRKSGSEGGVAASKTVIPTPIDPATPDRFVRFVRFVRSICPIRPIRPIYMPDRHARPRHERHPG